MDLMMDRVEEIPIGYDPPRFWWTKRIVVGSVVLVALVVGLVIGATAVAQRRLDALIESYRAAGEPVYVEDFNVFKDIPDDENAATYYRKAELAYVWPASITAKMSLNDLRLASFDSTSNAFGSEIQQLINTNGAMIELLKKGGQCEEAEWGYTLTSPISNAVLPNLRSYRNWAKLLSIAVNQSRRCGRDDEALDLLISLLRLGDHRSVEPPVLIGHMVALSITSLASRVVEHVGHELVVSTDSDETPNHGAPRRQVFLLIAELLDESALASSLSNALASERAMLLEDLDRIGKGRGVGWYPTLLPPMSWLIRPLLIKHSLQMAELTTEIKSAAGMNTYPKMRKNCPDVDAFFKTGANWTMPSYVLRLAYDRAIFLDFRFRAERRMAALSLAIRLFVIDHGARPHSLKELVPDYLDAVPRDPFAEGVTPIRYLPYADQPMLYSVGMDGADERGRYELRSDGSIHPDNADLVFFLNGDRPKATD